MFVKNNTSKWKMKVVLPSKENMKKKPKVHKNSFLFTIIATKTVKTHKKIENTHKSNEKQLVTIQLCEKKWLYFVAKPERLSI